MVGYDHDTADFLFHGFKNGFSIQFVGVPFSSVSDNLISALENPTVVDTKISKELEAHRLAGLFHDPPSPSFVFHL